MNLPRKGYARVGDAIAELGKELHRTAWTGEESPTKPKPLNETSRGSFGVGADDSAHAQAEEAHQRYRIAAYLLLQKLAIGERLAFVLSRSTGEISGPISGDFWQRDRALGFLVDGEVPVEWWQPTPPDYGLTGLHEWSVDADPPEYGRLFIAPQTAESPVSIGSAARPRMQTLTSNSAAPDAAIVATKGAGGRPRKHDWEAVQLELVRLDHEDGIANKTTSDLVRHVLKWCEETGKLEPAESEIKKRIRAVRGALGIRIDS